MFDYNETYFVMMVEKNSTEKTGHATFVEAQTFAKEQQYGRTAIVSKGNQVLGLMTPGGTWLTY